jgi:anaerobic magnesium-protoporphyrin IX monomethyl ester cyclase
MKVALIGAELEENLALRYLAGAVTAAGHEARILDFHDSDQAEAVARVVADGQPDVVGLSMVFTARAREFLDLAARLRAGGWRGHLVAGGHFAALNAAEILRDFPAVDSIVHGEGEEALVDLLSHLSGLAIRSMGVPRAACPPVGSPKSTGGQAASGTRLLEGVPGLSYRAADGTVRRNAPRPNPDNLDLRAWPVRPEVFHAYLGLPITNMLSSRGCYGTCSFCSIRAWYQENPGRRLRQRAAAEVAREMAALYHDRGVRIFNFHDDNFFLPREEDNLRRFADLRQNLDRLGVGRIAVQAKARPDSVTPAVMQALLDLGLFRVFLGVESNAVAGLVALGRGIRRERNHEALSLLRSLGVHTTFNLLMFEPEASVSDLRDNIAFMRRWADVPQNFCTTVVYAGTPLEARLRAAGRLEGNLFGRHYRMTDPRVQQAHDIVRRVFTPRQFFDGGMNLQTMKLEYYWQILKHFWPQQARPALGRKRGRLIRAVNTDSAALLDEICNFVETPAAQDAARAEAFAADVEARRTAFDAEAYPQSETILDEIRRLGVTGRLAGRRRLMGAASVAAALLVTAVGCSSDDSHMTEMAPNAPNKEPFGPSSKDELKPPPLVITPSEKPAPPVKVEPPPAPPQAEPKKAAPPEPRPDEAPLSEADAKAVQDRVHDIYQGAAATLATKLGVYGKPVRMALYLKGDGSVDSLQFKNPGEVGNDAFREQMTGMILQWKFPDLAKPGYCTVTVEVPKEAAPPVRGPFRGGDGGEMFEMAPMD